MANRNQNLDELWRPEGMFCPGPAETRNVGALLAHVAEIGSVLSLEGPLGAGKTELTKGLVTGLGAADVVASPSFALMHEYPGGRIPVFHFDFYRMEEPGELITTGYDDCLEEGVTVIEWGNKFPQVLPPGTIRLVLEILPQEGRRVFCSQSKPTESVYSP